MLLTDLIRLLMSCKFAIPINQLQAPLARHKPAHTLICEAQQRIRPAG